MDSHNEKKVGGTNGKHIIQGADQLIKNITQISSNQGGKIQNNWDSIKKYKLENNRVKEKIVKLKNNVVKHNEVEDANQKQKIIKIQEQGQSWTKKILIEIERQDLLKKEIEEVKKNMQQKNLKIGGSIQIGEQISEQEQVQLQNRQQQQKLDKIKAKNNEMVAQIQKLKEEVKVSRNERAFFDNVFKNLERDMKQKEEQIKQLVLDNTLNGYELKKQEEVSAMITQLMHKEQTLFKTAYESQMLSNTAKIFSIDDLSDDDNDNNNDLSQSIVVENSKIKENDDEGDDDDDDEDEENDYDAQKKKKKKNDITQTMNGSKIQEQKYENFLKVKKEFIAKINNDKVEHERINESIKKLLLMTNSSSIDSFKYDFKNIDEQIQELYKQSELLNSDISSLRKQTTQVEEQILGYQDQKECLIRQMDSKRQILTEKDRLIRDIERLERSQREFRSSNTQIEEDLDVLCKLIPPFLRELGVISDEFLRENIHMNIHPHNVLDFFGTIEKKSTLTNLIYNRLQERMTSAHIRRKAKKKETVLTSNTTYGNHLNTNKLPFNFIKIKEREKKQKAVFDFLDKMDQEKEADSLLMPTHFKQFCQTEFQKLNQQTSTTHRDRGYSSNIRESIRILSHISSPRVNKPSGYK